ncbi:hypothetical protein R5R35_008701 [Gryllus longicercus]|uniref:ABC transporter domain-containing protein n=1 Tax=Gryllus longicercus TaxID=2509291 RepID=A0AAN9VDH4_9ORTH
MESSGDVSPASLRPLTSSGLHESISQELDYFYQETQAGEGVGSLGAGAPQPPQGLTLTWRDVNVYARSHTGFFRRRTSQRRLVSDATGAVAPGGLTALMGGSGAGKSSLMAALAHRLPAGLTADGDIRVNGRPVGDFMHRLSGYMHQEDLFVAELTVREHLTFMARLRLDRRTRPAQRRRRVEQLLRQLGLLARADTRIGGGGAAGADGAKVLSGGERKRLAFATEMLTDPPLLFCDEPTTGLDAYSAHKLVHMMQRVALQGRTVLCTIHQPSSELFALFHQLVLVADGRVVFIGDAPSALDFFAGHGYRCPEAYNPAEFFMRALALTPGSEESSRVAIRRLCEHFAVSDAARRVDLTVRLQQRLGDAEEHKETCWERDHQTPPAALVLLLLLQRCALQIRRDSSVHTVRLIEKIAVALTAGLCYVGAAALTQSGVQAVQGALFILVTENTFSPMYGVLAHWPAERPLLARELRAGLYRPHLYYIAKQAAMLPGLVVEPVLFVLIMYWLVGLRPTFYAFAMSLLVVTITMNVATACGSFFGNAFESVSVAMAYLVPFDYALMITSGLFIKLSSLPPLVGWVRHASWFMYANEALSILQWDGVSNITCNTARPDLPCLSEGTQVLDQYSFLPQHLATDLWAMGTLYCTFHLLAYICLRWRASIS